MQRDSVSTALDDRKVLPRWRAPSESFDDFSAIRTPDPIRPRGGWLEKLGREFRVAPSVTTGREVLESAFILGTPLPPGLQEEIQRTGYAHPLASSVRPPSQAIADGIAGTHQKIQQLRALLKVEPKQPLAWTELARHHLSSGSADKAERAMQCALSLAPESRYVLRSATRLFERIGDPGQALLALKRSGRLTSDPWLLSADIALKGDRQSNSMKIGLRMLEDGVGTPRNLTELAAAVGTVEHDYGRHKAAKKMIAQSLVDPNENAIAQAIYISQSDDKIKLPDAFLDRPLTYEARARRAFANAAWEDSIQQSWNWLRDEPFDVKPAVLGSCLGFHKTLAGQAYDIATAGLSCLHNDVLLLNNRAVAGIYLGRLDDAFADLEHALRGSADRAYLLATIGLLAYRAGDLETGARAYGMSIAWLAKQKDREAVSRAYLYWLREAIRSGQVDGSEEIQSAQKILNKRPAKDNENEIPGLIEAIKSEIACRKDTPTYTTGEHKFENDALLFLESRIGVPQDAKDIYPLIAKDTLPEINQADLLSQ